MIEEMLKEYRKEEARILSLELAIKKDIEQEKELFRLKNRHRVIDVAITTLKSIERDVIYSLFVDRNRNSGITASGLAAELNYNKKYLAGVKKNAIKKLDDILKGIEL